MSRRDFDAEIRSLQARIKTAHHHHESVAVLEWRLKATRLAQLRAEIRAVKKSKRPVAA